MVNLADLPNAGALSGSETLPMQQGAGAVKVTANQLLSRAAGQVIPFDIGGTRIATITGTGVGIGTTNPETGLHVGGATESACTVRVTGNGTTTYGSIDLQSGGNVFRLRNPGGGLRFTQVGVGDRGCWDAAGNFIVGKLTTDMNANGTVIYSQGNVYTSYTGVNPAQVVTRGDDGIAIQFRRTQANPVGSIVLTSSSTSYNTTSDYRLPWKKGHVPLTGSGEFIDALNPRFFPEVGHAGFIAHQVAEVSPSSVTGEKDAVDEKGNPKYQQMDASSPDIMANIIAELQSLRRRVAALEAAT